jgi:hypothetical protein
MADANFTTAYRARSSSGSWSFTIPLTRSTGGAVFVRSLVDTVLVEESQSGGYLDVMSATATAVCSDWRGQLAERPLTAYCVDIGSFEPSAGETF